MKPSPVQRTIETYDHIAGDYLDRWRDRSPIQHHIERFIAMLAAYQLAGYPVLDLGCGPGFDGAILRAAGLWVIGIDLSWQMLAAGRLAYPGLFVQADMRQLPVAAAIGGLWVSASLLHLPRREVPGTLAGFFRALLPGGLMYLSVKTGQGEGWQEGPYEGPRFFSYWQNEEIDTVLEGTGFQIVEGWRGPGVRDEWLIRFARKPQRPHPLRLATLDFNQTL